VKIHVEATGPDWEPTEETRWYAQEVLPDGLCGDYAFGPTPQAAVKALTDLVAKREKP